MKKKEPNYLLKSLVFYKKHIGLTIAVFCLSFLYAICSLFPPILEGKILAGFSTEFNNLPYAQIIIMAVIAMLVTIFINVLTNIWSDTVLKLNENVNFDIKHVLFKNLTTIKTKFFDTEKSGTFISRLDKDSWEVSETYDNITDMLSEIFLNISFIFYIFILNVWIGLYTVGTIVVLYFVDCLQVKFVKTAGERRNKHKDNLISRFNEGVKGIRDIKNFNMSDEFIKGTDTTTKEYLRSNTKFIHTQRTWFRIRDIVYAILCFGFFVLSVFLIKNKALLVETFLIVYVYSSKMKGFIAAISNLRFFITNGNIAAKRIFEIIDYNKYESETFGDQTIDTTNGVEIRFENVSFSYGDNPLFENLNLVFEKGKVTAVVGKSGQGKTTIINLINKTYEAQSGKILVNGVEISDLKKSVLRDEISVVSQSPYIFNLSIKQNLRLIKPDATDEEIFEACKKAQIHDFIMSLPENYDSKISEDGVNLSGGQRQRIAIARALLKKSKVILFDEATSALDNESQEKIKNVIFDLKKDNHTIIIVAHRLSTIQNADIIYLLNDNKIVAQGTHQQLLNNPIYASLYNFNE